MTNEITQAMVRSRLPERPEKGHKGTFGHVFVIGGSRGFTGAVIMAATAAARSGAGLVTVGVPRPLGDVVGAQLVAIMSHMLDATPAESVARSALEPALEFAQSKDAVVLGTGMSQHAETCQFVLEFVRRCPAPLLIDADGLNCVSTNVEVLKEAKVPVVLTPHPGEMARLSGKSVSDVQADRAGCATAFSSTYGCVIVLKGHRTVVARGGDYIVNTTGNSGMATGGTGDALSGLIGGLMAQGVKPYDAAVTGVYLHGVAGDAAAERFTERSMIATDLIDCIPLAWRTIEGTPAS